MPKQDKLGWAHHGGEWVPAPSWPSPSIPQQIDVPASGSDLQMVTFNVMTDSMDGTPYSYLPHSTGHQDRYHHIVNGLRDSGVDFIMLQEVTLTFLEILTAQEWVQERYLVSNSVGKGNSPSLKRFGCVLMVSRRLPVLEWSSVVLPPSSRTSVGAAIRSEGPQKCFTLCAIHLIAAHKHLTRRDQILTTRRWLHEWGGKVGCDSFLLAGDFNYLTAFDTPPEDLKVQDVWESVYPGVASVSEDSEREDAPEEAQVGAHRVDPRGFTWDSRLNTMITAIFPFVLVPFRKRLDRIWLFRRENLLPKEEEEGSNTGEGAAHALLPDKIEIIFNKPIYPSTHAPNKIHKKIPWGVSALIIPVTAVVGASQFVGDYFGASLRGESSTYLFPSDHFGLRAQLKVA